MGESVPCVCLTQTHTDACVGMEGFLNQKGRIKKKKSNAVCVCECVFTKKEELAAVTVP